MSDPVNHPKHYNAHPSGVEAIDIAEHMNFCVGNAIKYLWRADLKNDAIEDLRKAVWYIEREIQRREKLAAVQYQPPNAPDVEQYTRQREAFFNRIKRKLRGDKE
jgi:sugar (pentulose or hexulose) kinase